MNAQTRASARTVRLTLGSIYRRAYRNLKPAFDEVVLNDQDCFRTDPAQWEQLLKLLPDRCQFPCLCLTSLASKSHGLTILCDVIRKLCKITQSFLG
jgi:hypothetical protein